MAGAVIRAQLKLEGGKAFKEDFDKASAAVKKANAEVGYFTTALDKNGRSQDALTGKTKSLQSAFDAEQKVIDTITKRIGDLSNMTGVDTTQAVDELTAELYKHKKAQAELGDQVDDTTEDFSEFGKEVGVASAIASKAVDIVLEIGRKVWDIGKGAVEYNAQMESYSKTIEAFFKTSGQGAEEAAQNTADLIQAQKQLAVATGIGTDKLIDANKMLIASGVSGNKSQQAISALAKAIVATGGGNEELSRMAQNLQQISNTGRASSQDLKQFAMAGVDVYGLLADTTGKSVEQLKEMDITFDMIVDALDQATQEGGKFFEASQVGASTLQGQMNLLDSTIKDSLGTAFQPINDALRDQLIPAAVELINDIDWNKVGDGIAWAVKEASDFVNAIKEFKNWYNEVYGQPAVKAIDTTSASMDDLTAAFIENAGSIELVEVETLNALESIKGHGNHMRIELDNSARQSQVTMQKIAGNVKNELINTAWDAMASGENVAKNLGIGMKNKSGDVESASANLRAIAAKQLSTLSSESSSWGMHMVEGFIHGINIKIPSVGTAAARAANAVRQVLEFTRPDKGPLHNYEEWMPHMMQGLSEGIYDNLWRIQDASRDVAATLAAPQYVANYNGGINIAVNAAQGQNANEIADEVMNRIQRATQRRVAVWA